MSSQTLIHAVIISYDAKSAFLAHKALWHRKYILLAFSYTLGIPVDGAFVGVCVGTDMLGIEARRGAW